MYYQLGADKRQHSVYNGRETVAPDLCSNMDNRVHWFPTEYLTYGLGGTPLISYKPFVEDGETYYIADHLGNTRVTLSSNGNVVSAKDFEPFGKVLHSNGNDRLTFIGKEKDAESDLGDFGVRKYEAEYGRFLQADRFWEQYYALSSYNYAWNNPILLSDPTGDTIKFGSAAIEKQFTIAYNYLKNKAPEQAKIIDALMNSTEVFKLYDAGSNFGENEYKDNPETSSGDYKTIFWDPKKALTTDDGKNLSPAMQLLHEAGHAKTHLDMVLGPNATDESKADYDIWGKRSINPSEYEQRWTNPHEELIITTIENPAAISAGEGVRSDHMKRPKYLVASPDSRTPIKSPANQNTPRKRN